MLSKPFNPVPFHKSQRSQWSGQDACASLGRTEQCSWRAVGPTWALYAEGHLLEGRVATVVIGCALFVARRVLRFARGTIVGAAQTGEEADSAYDGTCLGLCRGNEQRGCVRVICTWGRSVCEQMRCHT